MRTGTLKSIVITVSHLGQKESRQLAMLAESGWLKPQRVLRLTSFCLPLRSGEGWRLLESWAGRVLLNKGTEH